MVYRGGGSGKPCCGSNQNRSGVSERVEKLPYFSSWEMKKCVDRYDRSFAKKVPCAFQPSCFLLEVRSAGKLKISRCFAVFSFA